jgi:hypothetical protein
MRKLLFLSLALILILGIASHGTSTFFSDTETGTTTICAWVEICEPGSLIIVSDTNTTVTEAYTVYNNQTVTATNTPHYAVLAQHPDGSDPSRDWDNRITYNGQPYTFSDGAQWIWETWRTDGPAPSLPWQPWPDWPQEWPLSSVTGRVVRFERTFEIPCSPRGATLYITVDNGYTVWINGHLVGSAQVFTGWESNILTQSYVDTSNWTTVEIYTIDSADLVAGTNVLEILAANEYMGSLDGQSNGTWNTNPAGLIYWLEVTWGD